MHAIVEDRNGTEKSGELGRILRYRTDKAASGSAEVRTESEKDEYDRKVSLIQRAFSEISRLVFEYGYTMTADDWGVLDSARLDDLSYAEAREPIPQNQASMSYKKGDL